MGQLVKTLPEEERALARKMPLRIQQLFFAARQVPRLEKLAENADIAQAMLDATLEGLKNGDGTDATTYINQAERVNDLHQQVHDIEFDKRTLVPVTRVILLLNDIHTKLQQKLLILVSDSTVREKLESAITDAVREAMVGAQPK